MKKGFWIVVTEIIRKADVVLEVLDARMPELTQNKKLENFTAKLNKPLIFVFNKVDIISKSKIDAIKRIYRNTDYVFVSSKKSEGIFELIKKIKTRVRSENITVAIIGYPNTGKSSLINQLSKGGRARTSSESGFTKGIQLITGKGGLMLFDTPGVVPFGDRDEIRLGLISGISPSKLEDPDMVAFELIKIFKKNSPTAIEKFYKIIVHEDPDELIKEIGRKRNMLKKGGLIDERRAAIQLLVDWHKGNIQI